MNNITLGDIIGYVITFVMGIITGVIGCKVSVKKVTQNNNQVSNGDIVGGDKR